MIRIFILQLFLLLVLSSTALSLEPEEVLVVYNKNIPQSGEAASYYSQKRNVPFKNVMPLDLSGKLTDHISRDNYNEKIAKPIRQRLNEFDPTVNFRCILLVYGVPYKVGPKKPGEKEQQLIEQLKEKIEPLIQQTTQILAKVNALRGPQPAVYDKRQEFTRHQIIAHAKTQTAQAKRDIAVIENETVRKSYTKAFEKFSQQLYGNEGLITKIQQANQQIDYMSGKETNASVDSELSLVKYSDYVLYRWQRNRLRGNGFNLDFTTMMVSRLDGPNIDDILKIVDKSIKTEKMGLKGRAYFDARGLKADSQFGSFGYFDQAIRDAAELTRARGMETVIDNNPELFAAGQCRDTAIYCGWYSLKKYIPAFEFNDGAVGYHIASWEAVDIRDPNSTQWVPAMINAGITATLGAVSEPYLHSFPEPDKFFDELFNGYSVVEAYYRTKPFNSWQLVLIADPLYVPFGRGK